MIYFIQEYGEPRGPVKIGYTEIDPRDRVTPLQIGNPRELIVLATMPGPLTREQELHERFSEGRIRGEWFQYDTPGLADLIEKANEDEIDRQLHNLRWCAHCGIELVWPPRTRVCSDACGTDRKREITRKWKRDRRETQIPGSDRFLAGAPE